MFRDVRKRWFAAGLGAAIAVIAGAGMAFAWNDDDDQPITGDALERASAAALAETGGGKVTGTELDDEEGYYEVEVTLDDGTQVDVHLDESFNVLNSEREEDDDSDDGDDRPLTGDVLEQASTAALAHTGGGTVTETDAEGNGYEVEVTLDDGTEVDVQLDENFNVVSADQDDDTNDDDEGEDVSDD